MSSTINTTSLSILQSLRDKHPALTNKWKTTIEDEEQKVNVPLDIKWEGVRFDEEGNITVLDLGSSRIKSIYADIQPLVHLQTLNLGATYLPVQEITKIIASPDLMNLSHLLLGGNMMDDTEIKRIAYALKSSSCTIQKLDLRYNNIGPNGCREIANVMLRPKPNDDNQVLKELFLEGNQIGSEGAEYLSECLQMKHSPIISLHLGGNRIGPEGAHKLAASIEKNVTLTKLYLEGNSIGPEGALHFAEALKTNSTLKHLYVDNNNIGKEAMDILSKQLNSDSIVGGL